MKIKKIVGILLLSLVIGLPVLYGLFCMYSKLGFLLGTFFLIVIIGVVTLLCKLGMKMIDWIFDEN